MRRYLTVSALVAATCAASAATITLKLPGGKPAETRRVDYRCDDGRTIKAEYINSGVNALAVLKIGTDMVVAVTVLSGSGAKYAGQQYIWWTKGNAADLYDLTKGANAPGVHCKAM